MSRSSRLVVAFVPALVVSMACNGEPNRPVNAVSRAEDLAGRPVDPLGEPRAVLVFVTTECPISNRYAPTLAALGSEHASARFFLVYPDPDDDPDAIRQHQQDFALPGTAIRDPEHALVDLSGVTVTPEVAVFERGALVYRGRIDDRARAFGEFRAHANQRELDAALTALADGRRPASPHTKAIGCYIADLAG